MNIHNCILRRLLPTAFLLGIGLEPVLAQLQCSITQITNGDVFGVDIGFPAIDFDGSRVAFQSRANFTGRNADGNLEIFLWDAATNPQIIQITNTAAPFNNIEVAIAELSDSIVFSSNANLTGENADGNFEIFLWNKNVSPRIRQITQTKDYPNFQPAINYNATRIAFKSQAELIAGQNPDHNEEIFRWDNAAGFKQITKTTLGGSREPSINGSGTTDQNTGIAFASTANLLNGNTDHNQEIYLSGPAGAQITKSTGGFNRLPSINDDGSRVAFESDRNLTGGNSDNNREIFLFNKTTKKITQVTNTLGNDVFRGNFYPSINGGGNRIALLSGEPLTLGFPGFELFLYETTEDAFSRVTDKGVNSNPSAISGNGRSIVFSSRQDYTGGNIDGFDELFLAKCGPVKCSGLEATIVGTDGNDHLFGKPGRDIIHGLDGDDVITGFGGDDVICGGKGNDRLNGGIGEDQLFGQDGNDTLKGADDADKLFGGKDNDILEGGTGNDILRGNPGDDILRGQDDDDYMDGGEEIEGELDNDTCNGGPDSLTGKDTAVNCEHVTGVP